MNVTQLEGSASDLRGGIGWAFIALERGDDSAKAVKELVDWQHDTPSGELVKRELAELESWRVAPTVQFSSDEEKNLWRQSEVALRMAQSREPDRDDRHNHGLIIASLPDGAWFVPLGA